MKALLKKIKDFLIVVRDPSGFDDREALIPAWYGIAWYHDHYDRYVFMPMPLNVVASLARGAYFWCRHVGRAVSLNRRVAYTQGRLDGMRDRITDEDLKAFVLRQKMEVALYNAEESGVFVDARKINHAAMHKWMNSFMHKNLQHMISNKIFWRGRTP